MRWTIPNILTLLRLAAAPAVPLMFLYFHRPWADWAALAIFLVAAVTDWFDGYLARAWKQESRFGAAMDPIADKAMVVIAIIVITGYSGMNPWLILPATVILFREVLVSGLREFLGDVAGTLKVTKLAKWKTASQMVAIAVLILHGIFEHHLGMSVFGMDQDMVDAVMTGEEPDSFGLSWRVALVTWSEIAGLLLIWLAALLTVITGWDYFSKARPHLKD